jgi:type IV pilus assembly protein PilA
MQRFKGFTLIEIMIVAAIISILTAVAIPAYSDYLKRSQIVEGFLVTLTVKKAIGDYYAYHGRFPANNQAAGVLPPERIIGDYVSRVDVINGDIRVTFGHRGGADFAGKRLKFWPQVHNSRIGTLIWQCDGTRIDPKFLPSNCRQ